MTRILFCVIILIIVPVGRRSEIKKSEGFVKMATVLNGKNYPVECQKNEQGILIPVEAGEQAKAKMLYKKCTELRVFGIDDKDAKIKMQIVAETVGWIGFSFSDLKRLYTAGKALFEADRAASAALGWSRVRAHELALYEAQKSVAEKHGKAKYIEFDPAAMKTYKVVASGVGLASAEELARRNADAAVSAEKARRKEKWRADYRAKGKKCMESESDKLRKYSLGCSATEAEMREYVQSRLLDEHNLAAKADKLRIEKVKLAPTKGKNFMVQGVIKCPETMQWLGQTCVLDGSFNVWVKDSKGNVVAEGYYAAPGANVTDLAKVGFYNDLCFSVVCKVEENVKINSLEKYTCEFVPMHLWLIEL